MASGNHDHLIAQLEGELEALDERRDAITAAIHALTGTRPAEGIARPRHRSTSSVGADKLDAIRKYVRERGEVRQADIAKELDLNSGTVSSAKAELEEAGEIQVLPKRDRSIVWRALAVR